MKKCELDKKTPNWFMTWRDNEFWHLKGEVRWHTWALLVILVAVVGKLVIDFFWS